MPTAAKLVAAILLSITGFLAAQAVLPFLEEGTRVKWLLPVSIVVPIVCAWRTTGRLVGKGYGGAVNAGFYGLAVSIFYVLLTFAAADMIKRSMRKQYDGPMDAVVSMFGIWVEMGAFLLNLPVLLTLVAGGIIAGLAAEWANRKWS